VWRLHACRPERRAGWYGQDPVLAGLPTLRESADAHGTRPGQEFLICSDGRVVAAVNAFLASPRMASRSAGTRDKYGRGLCVWLGYLDAVGQSW
jgi:hypothetical protein